MVKVLFHDILGGQSSVLAVNLNAQMWLMLSPAVLPPLLHGEVLLTPCAVVPLSPMFVAPKLQSAPPSFMCRRLTRYPLKIHNFQSDCSSKETTGNLVVYDVDTFLPGVAWEMS